RLHIAESFQLTVVQKRGLGIGDWGIHRRLVACGWLLTIHGCVGAVENLFGSFTWATFRDPERDAHVWFDGTAFQRDSIRAAKQARDLFSSRLGVGEWAFENRHEFIPTPPAHEIARAYMRAEPHPKLFENRIAAQMAVIAVDALESVQVEK